MDDKLQILKMIEDGKINADEAAKLLDAIGNNNEYFEIDGGEPSKKFLRIKVLEPDENTKVNINLPISLIRFGLKFAEKVSPDFKGVGLTEEDMEEILQAIDDGQLGKIIEVDSDDGTKVEIFIE